MTSPVIHGADHAADGPDPIATAGFTPAFFSFVNEADKNITTSGYLEPSLKVFSSVEDVGWTVVYDPPGATPRIVLTPPGMTDPDGFPVPGTRPDDFSIGWMIGTRLNITLPAPAVAPKTYIVTINIDTSGRYGGGARYAVLMPTAFARTVKVTHTVLAVFPTETLAEDQLMPIQVNVAQDSGGTAVLEWNADSPDPHNGCAVWGFRAF